MLIITNLLERLFCGSRNFYPFELKILAAVQDRLNEESRELLQKQINAINRVQRIAKGVEVNCYQMHHGKSVCNKDICFPILQEEARLATVTLAHPKKNDTLKAVIWIVRGCLFSIVFNKPPGVFYGCNIRNINPSFIKIMIWVDPVAVTNPARRLGRSEA